MPAIFSTIAYIVEASTTTSLTSENSTVTRGVMASNRPDNNDPIFVNFILFNQSINSNFVYFLNGKFVYNKNPKDSSQELQVKSFFFHSLLLLL